MARAEYKRADITESTAHCFKRHGWQNVSKLKTESIPLCTDLRAVNAPRKANDLIQLRIISPLFSLSCLLTWSGFDPWINRGEVLTLVLELVR